MYTKYDSTTKTLYMSNTADEGYTYFSGGRIATTSDLIYKCQHVVNAPGVTTLSLPSTDCTELFCNMEAVLDIDVSCLNVSQVTDMHNMFSSCYKLTTITGLDKWDTMRLKNTSYMFNACKCLVDLSGVENWDTGNLTDMNAMFMSCNCIEALDLSAWDVTSVTTAERAFVDCTSLECVDLSNWYMPSLVDGYYEGTSGGIILLFNNCTSLKRVWFDNANILAPSYFGVFHGCSSLECVNIDSFDFSTATQYSNMFSGCNVLKRIARSTKWNYLSTAEQSEVFKDCYNLPNFDYNTVDLTYAYDCSSGGYLNGNTGELYWIENNNTLNFYNECKRNSILHEGGEGAWSKTVTSAIVNGECYLPRDCSYMFKDCSVMKNFKNANNFIASNVTSMEGMFQNCSSLKPTGTIGWDTTKVINTSYMFSYCNYFAADGFIFAEGTQVQDASYMYQGYNNSTFAIAYKSELAVASAVHIDGYLANSDITSVTDTVLYGLNTPKTASNLFKGCTKLKTVNFIFDASKCTDVSYMFSGCSELETINLNGMSFDDSTNTKFDYMFSDCPKLRLIYNGDVGWNEVTAASSIGMFENSTLLPNFNSDVLDLQAAHDASDDTMPEGYFNYLYYMFTNNKKVTNTIYKNSNKIAKVYKNGRRYWRELNSEGV